MFFHFCLTHSAHATHTHTHADFPAHQHKHHLHQTPLTKTTASEMNQPPSHNRYLNGLNIKCTRTVNSADATGPLCSSNLTVMAGLRTFCHRITARGIQAAAVRAESHETSFYSLTQTFSLTRLHNSVAVRACWVTSQPAPFLLSVMLLAVVNFSLMTWLLAEIKVHWLEKYSAIVEGKLWCGTF